MAGRDEKDSGLHPLARYADWDYAGPGVRAEGPEGSIGGGVGRISEQVDGGENHIEDMQRASAQFREIVKRVGST